MDVRLDQTATDQPPAGIIGLARCREMGLDRDDFAAGDADIQRLFARPISEAGIANDQIHAIVSLPYNSSSYAPTRAITAAPRRKRSRCSRCFCRKLSAADASPPRKPSTPGGVANVKTAAEQRRGGVHPNKMIAIIALTEPSVNK